jgi:hypothetical protein
MQRYNTMGLMLAATLSFGAVAGCQTPMQTAGQPAPAQQQAAAATGQHAAQAMAEEQEMDYYGYLADEGNTPAAYAVQAIASVSPSPSASPSTSPAPSASGSPAASPTPKPVYTPRPIPSFTPRVAPTPRPGASTGPANAFFKGKLPAEVKARIDERQAALRAKAKVRTDRMTAEKTAIDKATRAGRWVKNTADGTESQSIAFSFEKTVNGATFSRAVKMTRIRKSDDKTLVSATTEFSSTHNGITRKATRAKTLQEDGSYQVVFHSEMSFKEGSKRTVDWTKAIAPDGTVSGTGTIVWTGKTNRAVNLTFGGTEEAETARTADPETKTETTVTATAEGAARAEVKDTTSGGTAEVAVESDVDASVSTEPAAAPAGTSSPTP